MTNKFEAIDHHKLRKKVRAIIRDELGRFLLIQPHGYAEDNWTLVGGGVEDGESDWQAILREIAEETGIVAVNAIEMSTTLHWFVFSDDIKAQRQLDHDGQIAKVFFITIASETVIRLQKEELHAYCWVTFDEAIYCIKNAKQRELFIQVVNEFE